MNDPVHPNPGHTESAAQQASTTGSEQTDAAASDQAVRSASSEQLFEQGDPSLNGREHADTEAGGKKRPGKREIKWVRPTDLALQGAALTLKGGALGHLALHKWMRQQAVRGARATGRGVRNHLPAAGIGRHGPRQETQEQTPSMT